MQSISEIRALLEEQGLKPKKRFGQNFLHDHNQIRKLIDAADLSPGDLVLEVGPGTGALTEALLDAETRVIACEIDDGLAALIDERFSDRVTLVRGDCLDRGRALSPAVVEVIDAVAHHHVSEPWAGFKLVANLPYQVASPLMAALLIEHPDCIGQFVTIQKEVADRLLAPPGGKEYGPLGIIVQALATARRIGVVSPSCFWPQPKVTSAMVSILPSPTGRGAGGEGESNLTDIENRRAFARFVTTLFTKRRKQIGSILGRDRNWPSGVIAQQRPEALTVEQIIALWRSA
jgi:16S rRNA (adenine1518-N6/adenine1519-N6)-dimethyltransferase